MEVGKTCDIISGQPTITCARCNITEPVDTITITGKSMRGCWHEIQINSNTSLYLCRKCNKTYEKRLEKMRIDSLKDFVGEEKFYNKRNVYKEE